MGIRALFNQTNDYQKSYSQNGEDIIIGNILSWLNLPSPIYLDIGTFHPTIISNTYKLYKAGHHGVCVEPNPSLISQIKKVRKRDTCLNVGVGNALGWAKFYVMENLSLNTMIKEQALHFQNSGLSKIEKVIDIEVVTFAHIVENHLSGKAPDFISLDIEGMDLQVLQTIDFVKYRPKVLCVETQNVQYKKDKTIIEFMEKQGYFVCADTCINSIFVDSKSWENRFQ